MGMAGRLGFEPRYSPPKSDVLPLDDLPAMPTNRLKNIFISEGASAGSLWLTGISEERRVNKVLLFLRAPSLQTSGLPLDDPAISEAYDRTRICTIKKPGHMHVSREIHMPGSRGLICGRSAIGCALMLARNY